MEFIFLTLMGFLMAVILGQLIIPRILVISLRKRLFDLPDIRKVHNRPISRLGGVVFFHFFPKELILQSPIFSHIQKYFCQKQALLLILLIRLQNNQQNGYTKNR